MKCECKHSDHFNDDGTEFSCHPYGKVKATHKVKTPHGTFNVCYECFQLDHLSGDEQD